MSNPRARRATSRPMRPRADNAKRAAVNLSAQEEGGVVVQKTGSPRKAVAGNHVAGTGQKQGQSHVRGGPFHRSRRVSHRYVPRRRGRKINMVDADTEVADHLEVRKAVHDRSVDDGVAVKKESLDFLQRFLRPFLQEAPGSRAAVRCKQLFNKGGKRHIH